MDFVWFKIICKTWTSYQSFCNHFASCKIVQCQQCYVTVILVIYSELRKCPRLCVFKWAAPWWCMTGNNSSSFSITVSSPLGIRGWHAVSIQSSRLGCLEVTEGAQRTCKLGRRPSFRESWAQRWQRQDTSNVGFYERERVGKHETGEK